MMTFFAHKNIPKYFFKNEQIQLDFLDLVTSQSIILYFITNAVQVRDKIGKL